MRNASDLINPSAPAGKSHFHFSGTRLRLRQMREKTGDTIRTFHKLTQKIPAPDGSPGLLATLYLSEDEFAFFSALPLPEDSWQPWTRQI
jgi:hypothetical protein